MSNTIPPHYSDRYVQQRYNKALRLVQHSSSSSFQPTKEQKLQLYAYYKQVSVGNVNTPRPGLFDVVGRAKWDAWKKVEGINELEAQYRYVDVFLQAVSEAYQRPTSKIQAQQILQIFTMMGPAGEDDRTNEEMTATIAGDNHVDESSADEEEKAYLHDIQQNAGRSAPATVFRQVISPASPAISRRTSSAQSDHSNYRQPERSFLRPLSSASNKTLDTSNRPLPITRMASPLFTRSFVHALPRDSPLFDDNLEDRLSQNPWIAQQTANSSLEHQRMANLSQPIPGSSTSSSITATPSRQYQPSTQSQPSDHAYASIVSLGPATKRALESLQAQVIALNDRIDGLRNELAQRQRTSSPSPPPIQVVAKPEEDGEDGWNWVIKAALKHAVINLLTSMILLLVLYKRGNPAAYAVLTHLSKVWHKLQNRH